MYRALVVLTVLLGAGVLAGCGATAGAAPVTRDSAGVAIVENTAPAWREGEAWRLSAEPSLTIGEVDGPPEYQFGRVAGAVRLSDGRVVVADAQQNVLRDFNASGRHLASVGREGEGPGEFRSLAWVQATPEDSLLAYDPRLERVTVFSPQAEPVRSVSLRSEPGQSVLEVLGRLAGGGYLASEQPYAGPEQIRGGLRRDSVLMLRLGADGSAGDSLARIPGRESFVEIVEHGNTRMTLFFGRIPVFALSGDRVVLGTNDAYEMLVYSPSGALERRIRQRVEPRPVTDADVAALRQKFTDGLPAQWLARAQPLLEKMPVPATMPFYRAVLVDDAGDLWVEDYAGPRDDSHAWSVFDAQGRLLGSVDMPEALRPTQIGRDYVLGVWRDELGVESVRLYALEKPAVQS